VSWIHWTKTTTGTPSAKVASLSLLQLQQIYLAIQMKVDENDGRLPMAWFYHPTDARNIINVVAGTNSSVRKLFVCPAAPQAWQETGLTYVYNDTIRGQLLDDTLAACRVLWRDTPAELDSPTLSFHDIYCMPKPLQDGGVPIWIAGTLHARNLARTIEYGAGWIPIMGESVEGIAAGARRIRDAFVAAGRDPSTLKVQAPLRLAKGDGGALDLAASMASVPELVEAGATDVIVTLRAFASDVASSPEAMIRIRRAFDAATA